MRKATHLSHATLFYRKGIKVMDLRVLEYFLAVAREENMTNAAQTLHVTQPTLSRQMADLEKELGKTLFIRTNRQTLLTEDGMRLRNRAEEILSLVARTESEMKSDSSDVTGEIHIGAAETNIMGILAAAMKELHEEYPLIKYNIYSGNADDVSEKLEHGTLAFGLMIEPVNKSNYEYIEIPDYNVMGILMRKDSPFSSKEYLTAADLLNIPLFVPSRQYNNSQSDFITWMGGNYDNLNIVARYNLIYNAALMVECGLGNAICIDHLADTSPDSPLTFRPLFPEIKSRLVLVWKKYRLLSKPEQLFLEVLKASY
jgi:DNA-binding transcriptional LysR family regulator